MYIVRIKWTKIYTCDISADSIVVVRGSAKGTVVAIVRLRAARTE